MTDAVTEELLGVRAAARALGLNPSTVSRRLRDYPELNANPEGRHPKVDVAAYRRHQENYTNPARRGSHAGRLFGEREPADDLNGADWEGAGDGDEAGGGEDSNNKPKGQSKSKSKSEDKLTYARAKTVREGIAAQSARIDLDQKLRQLVPRAEVEAAVYEAGQKLQRDLLGLGHQLAEQLATMGDPREIAALMEAEHRRLLADLAATLKTEEPMTDAA